VSRDGCAAACAQQAPGSGGGLPRLVPQQHRAGKDAGWERVGIGVGAGAAPTAALRRAESPGGGRAHHVEHAGHRRVSKGRPAVLAGPRLSAPGEKPRCENPTQGQPGGGSPRRAPQGIPGRWSPAGSGQGAGSQAAAGEVPSQGSCGVVSQGTSLSRNGTPRRLQPPAGSPAGTGSGRGAGGDGGCGERDTGGEKWEPAPSTSPAIPLHTGHCVVVTSLWW